VEVEFSVDYIDSGIHDYETLDANCTRPTVPALRATLRFWRTVIVSCRTTSNGSQSSKVQISTSVLIVINSTYQMVRYDYM
jgi:hypothetical protein